MADGLQIPDVEPRSRYTADGVQTVFDYPFPIFEDANLVVWLGDSAQAGGYTVTGAGRTEGGSVQFDAAPAVGVIVTLERVLNIRRLSDFQTAGAFRADVINEELDFLTAAIQQVSTAAARGLHLPPSDIGMTVLPPRSDRAGTVLGFDAAGDLAVYTPKSGVTLGASVAVKAWFGGAAARTLAERLDDVTSALDAAGVDATGVSPSAAGLQVAVDAANAVRVPAGTYLIDQTVRLGAGQHLILMPGSVLRAADGLDAPVIEIAGNGSSVSGQGTIAGNSANQTAGIGGNANGIRIAVNVSGWTIRDITITDTESQGIRFSTGATAYHDWLIENVTLTDIDDHGIHCNAAVGGLITGCRVYNATRAAIVVVSGEGTVVHGNHARACGNTTVGQAAYYLEGESAKGVIFANNIAHTCTQHGFRSESGHAVRGAKWVGNAAINCGTAFLLNGAVENTIEGNTIYEPDDRGINILQCRHTSVVGNIIYRSDSESIEVQGGHNITVADNQIYNPGQDTTDSADERVGIRVSQYPATSERARDVSVSRNVIVDDQFASSMQYGIYIDSVAEDINITDNRVTGAWLDGVYALDAREITINGNDIYRNGRHGMNVRGAQRVKIDDNDAYDNGQRVAGAGINVEAGAGATDKLFITNNFSYDDQVEVRTVSTLDTVADSLTFVTRHGFQNGQRVRFATTGTLPGGLSTGTDYYVFAVSENTIKVAATFGGSIVDITSAGSGTLTATLQPTQHSGIAVVDPPTNPYVFDFNRSSGNTAADFPLSGIWLGGKHCDPVKPVAEGSATAMPGSTKYIVDTGLGLDRQLDVTMAFDSVPSGNAVVAPCIGYSTASGSQWGAVNNFGGVSVNATVKVFAVG